jgi:histidinol-phosphate/aromatic aminotransferase/cobyric acid decarboxylase-like protein
MVDERERFCSRLSTIPGIRPMPSIGEWVLLQVDRPADVARKINRRLEPGIATVPRQIDHAVRVPVREPKLNEALFNTIREVMVGKRVQSREFEVVESDAL